MLAVYIVLALFIIFLLIITVRALRFRPTEGPSIHFEPVSFDNEAACCALSEMIKCRTVSSVNEGEEDEAEFARFKTLLSQLFPLVFSVCELEEPSSRAILLRWKGKGRGDPAVLMAHYDVVSVDETGWTRPAFDGLIEDGFVWGRGAIDTKSTLTGILSAAEYMIKRSFTPENDIYFAFSGNEEIGGNGAPSIVSLFAERGITPSFVLDEGGAVVNGIFPGVDHPSALIGIAEKGMLNLEYSVKCAGGHSSSPLPKSPIGTLSKACIKTESSSFKFRLTKPTREMFDVFGRRTSFGYKLLFANLWCFAPLIDLISRKAGGEFSAIVRTTTAFTQMEGSRGINVIPPSARMASNHRIIPGESVDSVVADIKKRINDPDVNIKVLYGMDPSKVSVMEGKGWELIGGCARECFGDIIVSPYLMLACSDSRHWDRISDRVYRFSPMELTKEERALIHSNDERIPITTVRKTVEFYIRLIGKC